MRSACSFPFCHCLSPAGAGRSRNRAPRRGSRSRTTATTGATSPTSSIRSIAQFEGSGQGEERGRSHLGRHVSGGLALSPADRAQRRAAQRRRAEGRRREDAVEHRRAAQGIEGAARAPDRRVAQARRTGSASRSTKCPTRSIFKSSGEEPMHGDAAWVIDGTPKAGYKPKSSTASILPKMKARFWISKRGLPLDQAGGGDAGHVYIRRVPAAHRQRARTSHGAGARERRRLAAQADRAERLRAHPAGEGHARGTGHHLQRLQKFAVDSRVVSPLSDGSRPRTLK